MKRLLLAAGLIIGLLLAAVVALPFVVDPNRFRPMLEAQLSSALARQVHLGDLKLAILKGSVTAADLSIADDPSYSQTPFVRAKSLGITVEIWPFLTSRKLNVTGLTIDSPSVSLLQSPSGEWNFSSLGGKQKAEPASAPPASPSAPIDLSVNLIRITGGQFSLGSTERHSRPIALRDVEIEVSDFSAISEFPYSLKAAIVGGGRISLAGRAGPINPTDTAATPLSASFNIASLDLAGAGVTQNAPDLAAIVNVDGDLHSDGKLARIEGKIKADKLKLARGGSPARKPVELNFAVDHNLRKRTGMLKRGAIHIGAAPSSLTGTYALPAGSAAVLHLVFDGPKMSVDELTELLPAMAVVLPRGSSLKGGTASAHIAIDGPADRLVTAGTVSLDNTRLANFDMGKKLAFAEALAGIQPSNNTDIETLAAKVNYSPEGGRVDDLKFLVPAIGSLEGAGTVSPSNELAFQMRATVKNVSVPFFVQGTAADPAFRPDVKGIAKEQVNKALGSEKVKGLLKGILGK